MSFRGAPGRENRPRLVGFFDVTKRKAGSKQPKTDTLLPHLESEAFVAGNEARMLPFQGLILQQIMQQELCCMKCCYFMRSFMQHYLQHDVFKMKKAA